MIATDLTIPNGDITLAATLSRPETDAPVPLVICLHGTGELDRDENHPVQKLDVFNAIADHLVTRGIATLRFDKRGCAKSTGTYITAGQDDFLSDAGAMVAYARQNWGDVISKIFILGHSEGTLLAARLSLQMEVDGLVLLAPFAKGIEEILRAQAKEGERAIRELPGIGGHIARFVTGLMGGPVKIQDKLIDKVKASTEPSIRFNFQPLPAKSFRDLMALDPLEIYAKVEVPVLILGGEKDLQCAPEDVALIAAAVKGPQTSLVMDDLTHILRKDPRDHSFNSYKKLLAQPVDSEVLQIVGDWLVDAAASLPADATG